MIPGTGSFLEQICRVARWQAFEFLPRWPRVRILDANKSPKSRKINLFLTIKKLSETQDKNFQNTTSSQHFDQYQAISRKWSKKRYKNFLPFKNISFHTTEQFQHRHHLFSTTTTRLGSNQTKNFQCQILVYAGIRPVREATIGHVTDEIGRIPV